LRTASSIRRGSHEHRSEEIRLKACSCMKRKTQAEACATQEN
jgi:hypothetical protein